MTYVRKTRDEYDIEGWYGSGWEVVTCEETRKEARARLAEYRENEPGWSHRIIKRHVRIEVAA